MKNKNNVSFKDMYDYVLNYFLLPEEAYYFLRMEGADENFVPKRNNDIEYFNLVVDFIKSMSKNNQLNTLSEPFLMEISDMDTNSASKLLKMCYFPLDIKNKDFLYCIINFYNFFKNTKTDYGEHKFEAIKNYFNDNSSLSVFYKTLMAIDLNLLTDNKEEMESLLEKVDLRDMENYFIVRNIDINKFDKRIFVHQLNHIKKLYFDDKNKTL